MERNPRKNGITKKNYQRYGRKYIKYFQITNYHNNEIRPDKRGI